MNDLVTRRRAPVPEKDGRGKRFGRYTLRGLLASGGMADVYAAELESSAGFRKRVAIKRMRAHLVSDPTFVGMFLEEARLGSLLSHPKICEVYELAQVEGEYYMAMEYLHGVTLSSLLAACSRRGQSLPLPIVAGIFAQVCEGLQYAHERRDRDGNLLCLVHRDVSPQNLFIRDDGVVKVLDFGIAKADDSGHLTSTGSFKGKTAYMSPEQLQGKQLDRRTDVWSLGVVLFEALTGKRLFRRGALLETVYAIANEPIPLLSDLRPDAPPALCNVASRALCRERDWRFASAEKLRSALLQAMGGEGVAPPEAIGRLVRELCHATLAGREQMFGDSGTTPLGAADAELELEIELSESRSNNFRELSGQGVKSKPWPSWDLAAVPVVPTEFVATLAGRRAEDEAERVAPPRARVSRSARAVVFTTVTFVVVTGLLVMQEPPTAVRGPRARAGATRLHVQTQAATPAAAELPLVTVESTKPMARGPNHPSAEQDMTREDRETQEEAPAPNRPPATATPRRAAHARQAEPAAPGSLFVDSDPYATIYVDGKELGVTPMLGESIPSGTRSLRAVTADGRVQTSTIDIEPGQPFRKRIQW